MADDPAALAAAAEAAEASLGSTEESVRFADGREVRYRNPDQMIRAAKYLRGRLAAVGGLARTTLASPSKD
jgi:hypothetical protein